MAQNLIIENIESSLLNFCLRFATALNLEKGWEFESISFDSFTKESELPLKDLVGLNHVMVEVEEPFLSVECLLEISAYAETNGLRIKWAASHLFEELKPTLTIPYLDANTLEGLGQFTIKDGTRVMPVSGEERFARFFIVQLVLSSTLDLRRGGLLANA